jgi:L-lactate dehydrogenase complex protein LldE
MKSTRKVGLCSTCLVDQIMPEIGVATVKVLRRAGCHVDFPAEQTCCGQPFFNSGFQKQAVMLATRTIEIFEPYEAVVVPSGSCTTMIRLEYPHLLSGEPQWHGRAEALAAKTFELSEYLVDQVGWRPQGEADKRFSLTYHDSCHMKRMLGIKEAPRRLLEEVGCALHEMKESDRCCGFGGLFSFRLPEVSNAMTAEKLQLSSMTGADLLVTADPGCLMQMRGLAEDNGKKIQHLATILEEITR